MVKAPGSGAEGARFQSHYDLVKDHLPVKLALQALTVTACNCKSSGALKTYAFNFNLFNMCVNINSLTRLLRVTSALHLVNHKSKQVGHVSEKKNEETGHSGKRKHHPVRYEGLDNWLRRRAPVLKVHGSNPTMTWLKTTSLLSLPYRC